MRFGCCDSIIALVEGYGLTGLSCTKYLMRFRCCGSIIALAEGYGLMGL